MFGHSKYHTFSLSGTAAILIGLFFCFSEIPAQTRTPVFEQITLDRGLSQSAVHSIYQDSRGFMWFGTLDGLNMYDGYTFTIYRNSTGDSSGISDNWITAIYEDSNKNLWVGTADGGLNKFDPVNEKFKVYRNLPDAESGLSDNSVTVIYEDRDQNLLIGTREGGLNILNKNDSGFVSFKHSDDDPYSISSNRIRDIIEDNEGNLWIASDNGLNLFNIKDGRFKIFLPDESKSGIKNSNVVRTLFVDSFGTIWAGTGRGLFKFDRSKQKLVHIPLKSSAEYFDNSDLSINSIIETEEGILWLGTWDFGIIKFDIQNEKFLTDHQGEKKNNFPNHILTGFKDNAGNIWIGSFFSGVFKYSPEQSFFTNYEHDPANSNSPGNTITWGIYEDENSIIWIGTSGSWLNRFDPKTNKFSRIKKNPTDKKNKNEKDIAVITGDKNGNLWIGTWGDGISRYDMKSGMFKNFVHNPADEKSISNNYIRCILIDKSGNLWAGTNNGLNYFDIKEQKFKRFLHDPEDSASLSNDRVSWIHEDREGEIWIGTLGGGLNLLEKTTGKFLNFRSNPDKPFSLSNNRIRIIYEDENANLWIGTDNGLNYYNRQEGKFIVFTTSEGLPNNLIYGILPDEKGNLWMSTNKGISKFDPVTKSFRNFDMRDGLPSDEYNVNSFCRTKGGEMYFGTNYGFTRFTPSEIREKKFDSPVVITSFRIFDKLIKTNLSLEGRNRIDLSYSENFFSFEFAALNFSLTSKNLYAYKLEGFDNDWIYCGSRRYASYTNLDPGTYYFKVISSTNNKDWSGAGEPVKLIIHPPFWKTWWFMLIAVTAFLVLLVIIHRLRLNAKLKQILEIERIRKNIADDFHDELGHKLTKISLYSSLIRRNINDNEDYISKIQSTASTLFNETKDFIWSVDPGKDTLFDIAVYLKDFGDSIFDKTGIAFDVREIPSGFEKIKLPIEWKRQIILIFKEAMNNILKHSSAANAGLTVNLKENQIEIILTDDGSGIVKENPSGRGIDNMHNRAAKINSRLFIESKPGIGTHVTFISAMITNHVSANKQNRFLLKNVSKN